MHDTKGGLGEKGFSKINTRMRERERESHMAIYLAKYHK